MKEKEQEEEQKDKVYTKKVTYTASKNGSKCTICLGYTQAMIEILR